MMKSTFLRHHLAHFFTAVDTAAIDSKVALGAAALFVG
jgi:hypothetical protein